MTAAGEMKSAAIFYFSGTGNTEIVAGMLRDELSRLQYEVDLIRIEDVLKKDMKINTDKYDLIGIGSQVIAYSTPNIVRQFIKRLPVEKDKKVFIFRSAGGVAPVNYHASKPIIRALSKKGYDVFYERVFSIGSNWIKKFENGIIRQLHDATGRKAGIMCRELAEGKSRILKTGYMQKALMGFVGFAGQKAIRFVGKDYKVSRSTCKHCGGCIRNCPVDNIYEKNGSIKFRFSCNSCMRCVYSCPEKSIRLRLFSFFVIPGGYQIKKIIESPYDLAADTCQPAPPFFENYIKDDTI